MGAKCEQSPLGHQQIRQAKQREELRGILRQSAITRLFEPEHVLDEVERVLHPCPDAGLLLLDPFAQSPTLGVGQRTAFTRPQGNMPSHVGVLILFPLLNALIARITKNCRLPTVQQGVGLGDVVDISGGGDDRVDQSGLCIQCAPSCQSTTACLSWSGAFLGRAHRSGFWWKTVRR